MPSGHFAADMTGQKFGRLTVLGKAETIEARAFWYCVCDCGTRKTVAGLGLRNGTVRSCGCARIERNREQLTKWITANGERKSQTEWAKFFGIVTSTLARRALKAGLTPEEWVKDQLAKRTLAVTQAERS